MKELIHDSLNKVKTTQTIRAAALHNLSQDARPPMAHGSWELEHVAAAAVNQTKFTVIGSPYTILNCIFAWKTWYCVTQIRKK